MSSTCFLYFVRRLAPDMVRRPANGHQSFFRIRASAAAQLALAPLPPDLPQASSVTTG